VKSSTDLTSLPLTYTNYWYQDSANARLSPCARPYLSAIPAIVVIVVALNYLLGHYRPQWYPKWTKAFVSEQKAEYTELPPEAPKHPSGWAISLLIFSVIGFSSEIIQLLPPGLDLSAVILLVSWVSILPLSSRHQLIRT
jgi:hypothetical protein